jgi:hypothetical protein
LGSFRKSQSNRQEIVSYSLSVKTRSSTWVSFFFYAAQLLLYIVAPAVELSISPDTEHSRPENKRIPFAAAAVVFTSFSSFWFFLGAQWFLFGWE